jgi:DNA-binding transcriptional ArsR family regulator
MSVVHGDVSVSRVAAAIGEPARTKMLYCLMDGHARTSTELAIVAGVSPSTASVHLARLKQQHLVKVVAAGKLRYYSIENSQVAAALEALTVVVGGTSAGFVPNTPQRLRAARTCYDHLAGVLGVALHDRLQEIGWLSIVPPKGGAYDLTAEGGRALDGLGVDIDSIRRLRRRFAYGCLDWSERRPHVGGAVGAALLRITVKKKWVVRDLDSRALRVTSIGQRELRARFGLYI